MKDFLAFRRMLMPIFIHALFWLGSLASVGVGLYNIFFTSDKMVGLQIMVFGPLLTRIVSEFMILFFRMNETLTDIKVELQKKP